jgi:hypothetical protein
MIGILLSAKVNKEKILFDFFFIGVGNTMYNN